MNLKRPLRQLEDRLRRLIRERRTGRAAERIAPSDGGWQPWLEALLLSISASGVAWWASPQDPLLMGSSFPWLWLAPLLIALRYGVMPGILAAAVMASAWGLHTQLQPPAADEAFPLAFFIGGLLLTIIGGEFSAIWKTRLERRDEANLYLGERLSRLTRRYYLLRLSHDRLEQEMLVKPGSLRDALLRLRDIKARQEDPTAPLPGIGDVLQLLSQYCQLEAAAVYLPVPDHNGWSVEAPVAELGNPPPLHGNDPMLTYAMEQRAVAHVASEPHDSSNHLVMAPIIGSSNRILGLLVVSRMPFFALNRDTLQLMALLLGYYADVLEMGPEVGELQAQLPQIPFHYAEEMVRLCHTAQRVGVSSHIVFMAFPGPDAENIVNEIQRMRRGLDMIWRTTRGEQPVLVVLLPFASEAAKEGYLLRIDRWLHERHGGGFEEQQVAVREIEVGRTPPAAALANLLQGATE